ncbi:MAG: HNH endonuclease signature motif containing protein [Acidimicrobiales bacterium]
MADYTDKTARIVWSRSGGRCAFSGCGRRLILEVDGASDVSLVGQMAHIVGKSRQGPRGHAAMSDEDRRRPDNFLLLCPEHHKLIDDHPRRFPPEVLLRMKRDHETTEDVERTPVRAVEPENPERLLSTMLTPEILPGTIFSARQTAKSTAAVAAAVGSTPSGQLTPFISWEGRLYSFWDLSDPAGIFASVIAPASAEALPAEVAWDDPVWARRYVGLLNKSVTVHLATRGLNYDDRHRRHYFTSIDGRERQVTYESIRGRNMPFKVVRQERFKDGQEKDVWWHQAVRLGWERIDTLAWYLTIRPEFHLTSDGSTPLPPKRIGRKVTRKKSTMYNMEYLRRVHFWRWFLAHESPQLVLDVGQPIVVDTKLAETTVDWPGIQGDDDAFEQPEFEQTLLTHARLLDAVGNVDDWEELIA